MNRIRLKIKDVGMVKNGVTPSTKHLEYFNGDIVWLTPKDLSSQNVKYITKGERNITEEGFNSCSTMLLPKGTILLTSRAPIGLLSIAATDLCTNQGFKNIVVDRNKANNEFLYYYLKIQIRNIERLGDKTTFKEITKDDLDNFEVIIPEKVCDQQKIAAVLSAIDSKIDLNNYINAELEALAKTVYDYWFVQFGFPDKNGKPYKLSGGKMIWNAELKREIPEGWDTITIKQTLAKESSTKKIQSSEIMQKGTIPVIDQSTDFIAGYTDDDESIIKVEDPRIIFGDHTRVLKLINFDFARGADGTQVMLSNNRRMPQYLFYHMLLKIDLSNYGYARHYKFLKDQRIILPDEAVASTFNERVCKYYELVKQNTFQNIELSELRDWLLPMLMNGQVKVN